MSKDLFLVIRGTLDWCKLTGKARPHTGLPKYDKGPAWSVDITPDAKSRAKLAEHGLNKGGQSGTGKLRTPKGKDTRKESFITLKHLENRSDGTKNKRPSIKTVDGRLWDDDTEIGNGTVADIKVKVVDYGSGSDRGMYFQAARILKLVTYERDDFEELDEDDEYFASGEGVTGESAPDPTTTGDADLDDDVPF